MRYLIDTNIYLKNDWFENAICEAFGERDGSGFHRQIKTTTVYMTPIESHIADRYIGYDKMDAHSLIKIFDRVMRGEATDSEIDTIKDAIDSVGDINTKENHILNELNNIGKYCRNTNHATVEQFINDIEELDPQNKYHSWNIRVNDEADSCKGWTTTTTYAEAENKLIELHNTHKHKQEYQNTWIVFTVHYPDGDIYEEFYIYMIGNN